MESRFLLDSRIGLGEDFWGDRIGLDRRRLEFSSRGEVTACDQSSVDFVPVEEISVTGMTDSDCERCDGPRER